MRRNFERRSGRSWKPEAEGFELFKELIKNWTTAPEGAVDYCPLCWRQEQEARRFSEEERNSFRPTLKFAEKRLGTDGWSAICQKCGKEVFIRLP